MTRSGPPRLARWLLALLLRGPDAEFVLGDIEEDWGALRRSRGARAAAWWYRRQALRTAWAWVLRGVRGTGHAGRGGGMEGMTRDIRHGLRGLVRRPGFSTLVVATLALGIGATTAIFSVVNGVMIRALPFPESDRLVDVAEQVGESSTGRIPTSLRTFRDWREGTSSFDVLAAVSAFQTVVLTGRAEALRIRADLPTPGWFDLVGARAVHGRLFLPEEGESLAGDHTVAVLSHGLWTRAFGADPAAVGRSVTLSGRPYTVVGVLDPAFQGPLGGGQPTDVYLPITEMGHVVGPRALEARLSRQVQVMGRLREGRTLADARADLHGVMERIRAAEPEAMGDSRALVQPLRDRLLGQLEPPLLALLVGAVFLLVVACINVASLLLVRGAARTREVAVRLALGGARGRLIRQLTTESLILAALGGVGGVLLASVTLDLILRLNERAMPSWVVVELDATVLAASFVLAVATGLAAGLGPALRAAGTDLRTALTLGDPRSAGSSGSPGKSALVVLEVATATVLMVGSGLMIRSFQELAGTEMGFRTERLLTALASLPVNAYPTPEAVDGFRVRVLEELERRPGVAEATLWGPGRPGQAGAYTTLLADDMTATTQLDAPLGRLHNVLPGGLETMEIALVAGRTVQGTDRAGTQPVVVLSESLARTLFGDDDPLGRRVRHFLPPDIDPAEFPPYEVVGVVADARHQGRGTVGGPFDVPHDMYFPAAQRELRGTRSLVFLVATAGDPSALIPTLRDAVRSVDPDVPLFAEASLADVVARDLVTARFVAVLLGTFGVLSLFLAALGIYGVLGQAVSERRREVGLRAALGARPADTVRIFVGQGFRIAALGVVVGLALSLGLTRFVSGLLFGVAPHDPSTLLGTAGLLLGVALLAALLPTVRALRVTPMTALRTD